MTTWLLCRLGCVIVGPPCDFNSDNNIHFRLSSWKTRICAGWKSWLVRYGKAVNLVHQWVHHNWSLPPQSLSHFTSADNAALRCYPPALCYLNSRFFERLLNLLSAGGDRIHPFALHWFSTHSYKTKHSPRLFKQKHASTTFRIKILNVSLPRSFPHLNSSRLIPSALEIQRSKMLL